MKEKWSNFLDDLNSDYLTTKQFVKTCTFLYDVIITVLYLVYVITALRNTTGRATTYVILVSSLLCGMILAIQTCMYFIKTSKYTRKNFRNTSSILQYILKLLKIIAPLAILVTRPETAWDIIMYIISMLTIVLTILKLIRDTMRISNRIKYRKELLKKERIEQEKKQQRLQKLGSIISPFISKERDLSEVVEPTILIDEEEGDKNDFE